MIINLDKDEINSSVVSMKSGNIKDDYLINVIINTFDNNFNHQSTIQSDDWYKQ